MEFRLPADRDQYWARVSPDGRHVAYISNETGVDEVYLRRFPTGEGKWQVSLDGGHWPYWSRDGSRLYYAEDETLMEVEVTTGPTLLLGRPRSLFTRSALAAPLPFGWPPGFDVSDDDQRFLIFLPMEEDAAPPGIVVIESWAREFEGGE